MRCDALEGMHGSLVLYHSRQVASRVESAIKMKEVTKQMGGVVKGMDKVHFASWWCGGGGKCGCVDMLCGKCVCGMRWCQCGLSEFRRCPCPSVPLRGWTAICLPRSFPRSFQVLASMDINKISSVMDKFEVPSTHTPRLARPS